jgi:hypothetical protein
MQLPTVKAAIPELYALWADLGGPGSLNPQSSRQSSVPPSSGYKHMQVIYAELTSWLNKEYTKLKTMQKAPMTPYIAVYLR